MKDSTAKPRWFVCGEAVTDLNIQTALVYKLVGEANSIIYTDSVKRQRSKHFMAFARGVQMTGIQPRHTVHCVQLSSAFKSIHHNN